MDDKLSYKMIILELFEKTEVQPNMLNGVINVPEKIENAVNKIGYGYFDK